jgi:hypothetical protein
LRSFAAKISGVETVFCVLILIGCRAKGLKGAKVWRKPRVGVLFFATFNGPPLEANLRPPLMVKDLPVLLFFVLKFLVFFACAPSQSAATTIAAFGR